MFSPTNRALEDFDNRHEFERMAADILNGLGYSGVEPMAPGGGSDGGRDVRFRDAETEGIAFVTLDKKIVGLADVVIADEQAVYTVGSMAGFCYSR